MLQTKDAIVYVLMGLSVGLLFFSVASTQIVSVDPSGLGLASSLPITFWAGLVTLGLLWFFGINRSSVLAVALVLTVGYLFVAPAVMREPVWLSNSYYPFGESSLVSSSGHLVNRVAQPLNAYHDWPLFIYFSSVITQLAVFPTTPLLKFFPIFIISACGLLAFLILRIRFTVPQSLLGVGIFVASFWFRQQYFGPPGFGLVLFLMGLFVALKFFFTDYSHKAVLAGLFLLVFAGTIFTHFLSAVMLLSAIVVLYISQRFAHVKSHFFAFPLIVLSVLVFLDYTAFFTPEFFSYLIGVFSSLVSFQGGILQESARLVGSAAQVLNYRATLGIVALDCIVPLVGVLLLLRNKVSRSKFFGDGFNVFAVILMVILGVFAAFFQYGPHEGYQRALLFALVPLAYFSVLAVAKRPKLLVVVIFALMFLNIPAQYGADSYTLETHTDLAGAQFFVSHTPNNIVVMYDFSLLQRYFDPAKNMTFKVLEQLPFTSVPDSSDVLSVASGCDYVILSNTSDNFYYYFMRQTPISDTLDGGNATQFGFNRVYDNGGFVVLSHG